MASAVPGIAIGVGFKGFLRLAILSFRFCCFCALALCTSSSLACLCCQVPSLAKHWKHYETPAIDVPTIALRFFLCSSPVVSVLVVISWDRRILFRPLHWLEHLPFVHAPTPRGRIVVGLAAASASVQPMEQRSDNLPLRLPILSR